MSKPALGHICESHMPRSERVQTDLNRACALRSYKEANYESPNQTIFAQAGQNMCILHRAKGI